MFLVTVLAVFLAGIFAILLAHKYKRTHSKYMRNIPGKEPNIFLGNLWDFAGSTDKFLKTICSYLDTYGPITTLFDGPFSVVILTAEEKFIEYILSSTKMIDKSDQYNYFHGWLGTGLLTSTGAKWRKRRKMLTPSFHFSILENFVDIFDRQGDIFVKELEREAGKPSFDIYPYVTRCTLDIICEAAMGISINSQKQGSPEYTSAVKTVCSIIIDRSFSPLSPSVYPFTLNHYNEKKALKVLHTHTDEVIDRRIRETQSQTSQNAPNDESDLGVKKRLAFLDLLLKSTLDGQPLSRTDIREEVDTFMFEGHDTTSSAIAFAIYSLAMNPEVQRKALEEQKELFGDLKNAKPVIADLQNMKYMDLVIKECLRLYPSVPWFARKVPEDFEWEGTLYPKGLNIVIVAFASQRSAKYFPDPLKFIPERFENIDGKNPYTYIPFSAGPRNCIGQKFAILEMKSTVSKVLRNFELSPATPTHELKLAPEIILVSKNGVRLSLKKRK
ncbi:unnamed protein product [Phaedon cochleariae]|uniref:Cytochrome P450 n=1 Tax=Phaedon cochleariae TaxID=80249 RepID=A0A9P0DYW7_PHACE|nr:unnamed protein product [Phaedon cochleariae]